MTIFTANLLPVRRLHPLQSFQEFVPHGAWVGGVPRDRSEKSRDSGRYRDRGWGHPASTPEGDSSLGLLSEISFAPRCSRPTSRAPRVRDPCVLGISGPELAFPHGKAHTTSPRYSQVRPCPCNPRGVGDFPISLYFQRAELARRAFVCSAPAWTA